MLNIELKKRVRELVYGSQDGIISTLGLLAGVHAAFNDRTTTIITGIAAMLTGGLSMATASYLSSKSQDEIEEKELEDQRNLLKNDPLLLDEELSRSLLEMGLSKEVYNRILLAFRKEEEHLLVAFHQKILGLESAEPGKPVQAAIVMFLSFITGSFIPILPYIFITRYYSFQWSVSLSVLALFSIGLYKGHLAAKSKIVSGLEFILIAFSSAGAGWLVGKLFEHIYGIRSAF